MKKCSILLAYFLVFFSLVSNIAVGVISSTVKVEMTEKEGKEIGNKADIEKDKIFQDATLTLSLFVFLKTKIQDATEKISSPTLGTEINPPDFRIS